MDVRLSWAKALGLAGALTGFAVAVVLMALPSALTTAFAADAKPIPVTPVSGTRLSGLSTTLRWVQEADSRWFQVQVIPFSNDGPGINLIIGDESQVAAASYQVREPDFGSAEPNYVMLPDITYSWRVRTADTFASPLEGDWSPWSDSMTFKTATKSSDSITLLGPRDGAGTGSLRPTLQWGNSDETVFYYEVQVSRDSGFCAAAGCPMLYWELRHGGLTSPMNSYTIPDGFPLQANETYFWRVRPRIQGDGAAVAWTAAASFHSR